MVGLGPAVENCRQVVGASCHIFQFQSGGIIYFVAHHTLQSECEVETLVCHAAVKRISEVGERTATIHSVTVIDGTVIVGILELDVARFGTGLNQCAVLRICLYLLGAVEVSVSWYEPASADGISCQSLGGVCAAMHGATCDELRLRTHFHNLVFIE